MFGCIAQFGRAPALRAGGYEFESRCVQGYVFLFICVVFMSLKAKRFGDKKRRERYKLDYLAGLADLQKKLREGTAVKKKRGRKGLEAWVNPKRQGYGVSLKKSEEGLNKSPVRIRNRCSLTGRSRAISRVYGVSRMTLRISARKGLRPGVRKMSW